MEIEDLNKVSFIVDIIPTDFKKMGIFMMSGMYFMHLGDKKCIMISFEEGDINYAIA